MIPNAPKKDFRLWPSDELQDFLQSDPLTALIRSKRIGGKYLIKNNAFIIFHNRRSSDQDFPEEAIKARLGSELISQLNCSDKIPLVNKDMMAKIMSDFEEYSAEKKKILLLEHLVSESDTLGQQFSLSDDTFVELAMGKSELITRRELLFLVEELIQDDSIKRKEDTIVVTTKGFNQANPRTS